MFKKIKEYRYAKILYRALYEQSIEDDLEVSPIAWAHYHRYWDYLRELERIELKDKARFFRIAIYGTLILAALGSSAMTILMVMSNGLSGYNHAITSFEIQMVSMLFLHFYFVIWRALWAKKLKWLGLSIPIDLE